MAVAFVQSSVPALSRTAAPPGLLRGGSTSGKYAAGMDTSFSAPSMLAFAAASTGLMGLAGSQQKGRRSSQHNVVKCRAMPAQGEVPSKEDVAAAKKKADLMKWAAKTLEGQPQAAEMQAKAEAKMHIYDSLKAAFEQGAAVAPAAAAAAPPPAAAAPQPAAQSVGGNVPSKEEVAAAKKTADLAVWAAKALQGQPQAAAMQAKAEAALQTYESLKAACEQGAPAAPSAAAMAAPAAAAVPPPAAVSGKIPSKDEVAEAKKKADLNLWAANTLKAKGSPEAAAMEARATRKVQEYEALKAAFEKGTAVAPIAAAAPAVAAPTPAAAPAAPAAPATGAKPSPEELAKLKKETDLMVWAANSLSAKGAPQAAEMQAKAQQKVATYESLKALAMA